MNTTTPLPNILNVLEINGSEDSGRMGVFPKLVHNLFLFVWKLRARVRTVAAAIWPGRCPPPYLIVLQPSAETWTANCCFDLT